MNTIVGLSKLKFIKLNWIKKLIIKLKNLAMPFISKS